MLRKKIKKLPKEKVELNKKLPRKKPNSKENKN